jgi:ATP-dependent Lhr-like helicase
MGGRVVKVRQMQGNTAIVEPAAGERVAYPRWMGAKMPLSAQLAHEQLALRRVLRESWENGGADECYRVLRSHFDTPPDAAKRVSRFVERQYQAAPLPVDNPVQIERVRSGRSMLLHFHILAGRAINRSLAWVVAHRTVAGSSAIANFDDHGFLLSVDARREPNTSALREAFDPRGFRTDLRIVLEKTETLGRRFRAVAEIGQLLPRRTLRGETSRKTASWSGSLLYRTLLEYEPDHPLVRECVRGVMEDECDAAGAEAEAARIYVTPFEVVELPRPSPFGLSLYAAFNRETLLAQDPDRALDDLLASLYSEWESPFASTATPHAATSAGSVRRRKRRVVD